MDSSLMLRAGHHELWGSHGSPNEVTQPVSLLEWFSNFYEEYQPQTQKHHAIQKQHEAASLARTSKRCFQHLQSRFVDSDQVFTEFSRSFHGVSTGFSIFPRGFQAFSPRKRSENALSARGCNVTWRPTLPGS